MVNVPEGTKVRVDGDWAGDQTDLALSDMWWGEVAIFSMPDLTEEKLLDVLDYHAACKSTSPKARPIAAEATRLPTKCSTALVVPIRFESFACLLSHQEKGKVKNESKT